jgi:hypothetical protein
MLHAHDPDLVQRRLSVAFWPVDALTHRGGEAVLVITLEEGQGEKRRAIRNRSGYYCFEELDPRLHAFRVRDARELRPHYLEQRIEVDVGALPARMPVRRIDLAPAPDYPFDPGVTLVRGQVVDPSGAPVADAHVELRDADVPGPSNGRGANRSDAFGCFVVVVSPDVPSDPLPPLGVTGTRVEVSITTAGGRSGSTAVVVQRGRTANARRVVVDVA